jgi:hypothetical protein
MFGHAGFRALLGAYQRAGECYQAAGEYALANRAFFRALGPESAVTLRPLPTGGTRRKRRGFNHPLGGRVSLAEKRPMP